jgi:hypothetical protein
MVCLIFVLLTLTFFYNSPESPENKINYSQDLRTVIVTADIHQGL